MEIKWTEIIIWHPDKTNLNRAAEFNKISCVSLVQISKPPLVAREEIFQKWTSCTSVGVSGWPPVSSTPDINLVEDEAELVTLLLVDGRGWTDAVSEATTRSMWRTTCSAAAGSTRVRAQTDVNAVAADGELRPRTAALMLAVARTEGRLWINSGSGRKEHHTTNQSS